MKKYTSLDFFIDKKDENDIILNYKIEDNKIFIDFTDKLESHIIPYTYENEKRILEQMKEQILKPSYTDRVDDLIKFKKKNFDVLSYVASIAWFIFELSQLDSSNGKIVNLILIGCAAFIAVIVFVRLGVLFELNKILTDIDKNTLFIENEDEINEYLKENPDVIDELPKKAKELIFSPYNEKQDININILDKIKYKQLKKLLERMKIDEKFGFESSEENNELALLMKKYDESNAN